MAEACLPMGTKRGRTRSQGLGGSVTVSVTVHSILRPRALLGLQQQNVLPELGGTEKPWGTVLQRRGAGWAHWGACRGPPILGRQVSCRVPWESRVFLQVSVLKGWVPATCFWVHSCSCRLPSLQSQEVHEPGLLEGSEHLGVPPLLLYVISVSLTETLCVYSTHAAATRLRGPWAGNGFPHAGHTQWAAWRDGGISGESRPLPAQW